MTPNVNERHEYDNLTRMGRMKERKAIYVAVV